MDAQHLINSLFSKLFTRAKNALVGLWFLKTMNQVKHRCQGTASDGICSSIR